jgi:hypothetical protein
VGVLWDFCPDTLSIGDSKSSGQWISWGYRGIRMRRNVAGFVSNAVTGITKNLVAECVFC